MIRGNNMNIMSIDPSLSCSGIYIESGDIKKTYTIKTKIKDKNRLLYIYSHFQAILKQHAVDVALIEDYPYHIKNSRSVTKMAECKGIFLAVLQQFDINAVSVPISTWKSWFILPDKKKDKGKYIKYIKKNYQLDIDTVDEADAILIAEGVKRIIKRRILTDTEQEIKNKIIFKKTLTN